MKINIDILKGNELLSEFFNTDASQLAFFDGVFNSFYYVIIEGTLEEDASKLLPMDPITIALILGKPSHLEFLLNQFSNTIEIGLSNRISQALSWLAAKGQIDLFLHLMTYQQALKYVTESNNEALRYAATNGHEELVNILLQIPAVTAAEQEDSLQIAFARAIQNKHVHVARLFFPFFIFYPKIFNYLTSYEGESTIELTDPFIRQHISELKKRKIEWEEDWNTIEPFNVSPKEAELWYYIILDLIYRQRGIELLDLITKTHVFQIPSIREIAHKNNNALIKCARKKGNTRVTLVLRAIPDVAALEDYEIAQIEEQEAREAEQEARAQAHRIGYFKRKSQSLRQQAQDPESSMVRLSDDEELAFAHLTDSFKATVIKKGGSAKVIEELRQKLIEEYNRKPAHIFFEGEKINLPLSWEELQLISSRLPYERVLQAYYKHKIHTVYRYLLKPNPWLHPDAYWVTTLPESNMNYVAFDRYLDATALAYLVAKKHAALDAFIFELDNIERRHNRDGDSDDAKADRPSCPSGIRRAIYQSIAWLFETKELSEELIKQEAHGFIYNHFKKCINNENRQSILQASKHSIEHIEAPSQVLTDLNISPEVQKEFARQLQDKYKEKLENRPDFQSVFDKTLQKIFKLDERNKSHLIKFYTTLKNLLILPDSLVSAPVEPISFSIEPVINNVTLDIEPKSHQDNIVLREKVIVPVCTHANPAPSLIIKILSDPAINMLGATLLIGGLILLSLEACDTSDPLLLTTNTSLAMLGGSLLFFSKRYKKAHLDKEDIELALPLKTNYNTGD